MGEVEARLRLAECLLEDRDRSLAEAAELGAKWHGAADGRLRYAVAPRFALSCTPELLEGCAALARDNGWLLQTHACENRTEVSDVRLGKLLELTLDEKVPEAEERARIEEMCRKLLANTVIEDYRIEL